MWATTLAYARRPFFRECDFTDYARPLPCIPHPPPQSRKVDNFLRAGDTKTDEQELYERAVRESCGQLAGKQQGWNLKQILWNPNICHRLGLREGILDSVLSEWACTMSSCGWLLQASALELTHFTMTLHWPPVPHPTCFTLSSHPVCVLPLCCNFPPGLFVAITSKAPPTSGIKRSMSLHSWGNETIFSRFLPLKFMNLIKNKIRPALLRSQISAAGSQSWLGKGRAWRKKVDKSHAFTFQLWSSESFCRRLWAAAKLPRYPLPGDHQ